MSPARDRDAEEARVPDGTHVSDYDYELPGELIAQYPAERRDGSRLLVLGDDGSLEHLRFTDLTEVLAPGDLLVVNESRVLPARLRGRKPTGADVEVLLSKPAGDGSDEALWEALVRPGAKLKPGRRVIVAEELEVEIVDSVPTGSRVVRLHTPLPVQEAIERFGRVPLPPYVERPDEAIDRERYQTVYARTPGSIAAPTAGLHFTPELLRALERRGVARAEVTLHVGIGTFRPVEVDDPREHVMHRERYTVGEECAAAIARVRADGGRVWAVGTTVVRTLETAAEPDGAVRVGSGETDLFIRPPFDFRVVDGLLTNFHLPRSTLLMLVAALAGYDDVRRAYAAAVARRYRFYSYGDAMAIMPRGA